MKNTRKIIALIVMVALIASFSVTAFAEEVKPFSFAIPEGYTVKEVVIRSETTEDYLMSKMLPEAWKKYGGEKIAEFVAYDRYSRGQSYLPEFADNGDVIFTVTAPTTILNPSKLELPAREDVTFYLAAIGIPNGTAVEYSIGEGQDSIKGTAIVKNGVAVFSLPRTQLEGMKPGQALKFAFRFIVNDKEYEEVMYALGIEARAIPGFVYDAGYEAPDESGSGSGSGSGSADPSFHGLKFSTPFGEAGFEVTPTWWGLSGEATPFINNNSSEPGFSIGGGTEDTQWVINEETVGQAYEIISDFIEEIVEDYETDWFSWWD